MIISFDRLASFVGAFGEGDVRASNIRYFFPEGCQAPRIEVDPVAAADPNKNKKLSNEVGKTNDLNSKNVKGANKNVMNNDHQDGVNKNLNKDDEKKKLLKDNNLTTNNVPAVGGHQYGKQTSSPSPNSNCCDGLKPQILFPRTPDASQCGKSSVAKIVIPIDLSAIQKIPMNEIVELTSEKVNIEMIRKLMKLAEKYQI